MSVFNFISTNNANKDTREIVEQQLPLLNLNRDLTLEMARSLAFLRGYILYGDQEIKNQYDETLEETANIENELLKLIKSEEIKNKVESLVAEKAEWESMINNSFAEYEQGNQDEALKILAEAKSLSDEILNGFNEIAEHRGEIMNERGQAIISGGNTRMIIAVVVPIFILMLGIVIALITSNIITKPVVMVMERMNLVADGDLSHEPMVVKSNDEIAQLVASTNTMSKNTRDLLNKINTVSETVTSQSEELSQSANEVSEGAEQIASTMQELASGSETQANNASELSNVMGVFATKINEANNNGRNIQESSNGVLEMTSDGYRLMEKSTSKMNEINEIVSDAVEDVQRLDNQSQKISELVNVIEDIAEQTNLLALNAAIEAARAGEHGQGFSVVAEEVRKLAEGVSESVTDITDIVTDIQEETTSVTESLQNGYGEVEQGTNQIMETGETFNEISSAVEEMVNNIRTVTDNLTDIAGESEQMNSSIQEIAAVSEESAAGVEQTTASAQQTNSAMEEVTASSNDLATLAEELNELVHQFKL